MSTYDLARDRPGDFADASHGSGYIREAAVRRLGRDGGPGALPVLIVRLNDWVPAVRAAAREATIAVLGGDRMHVVSESDVSPFLAPGRPLATRKRALARVDAALEKAGPHLGGELRAWIDGAIAPWRKR